MGKRLEAFSPDPLIGRIIGKCRLEKLIGKGGMGYVFRATHQTLQRLVAVKVSPLDEKADAEDVERFLLEARTAARLEHPNVVDVYDVDREEDFYYLVMRYVEGDTLRTRLGREGFLSWPESCRIAREVAAGLQAAHELDPPIVHRDIKPGNIMLDREGRVRILDFGMVRLLGEEADEEDSRKLLGTPSYMAPENAQDAEVDQRADIYSLGVTLFFCLTGRKPYDARTSLEMIYRHVSDQAPQASSIRPDLPEELDQLLARMIAKRPSDRCADCREVIECLERILEGAPAVSKTLETDDNVSGQGIVEIVEMDSSSPGEIFESVDSEEESPDETSASVVGFLGPPDKMPYLGQDVERRRLVSRLKACSEGISSLVFVQGAPGMGRSRFGREIATLAEAKDYVISIVSCGDLDSNTTHRALGLALLQIIDSLGEHLRSTLKEGALDWAIDLLPVVPELESRLLLEDARSTTWPSYGNLLQGFRTLSRLLSAMPGHIAIYLDDFENAKEEEWEIVMDLVSEESIQLLLLVSVPDTFDIERSDSSRAAKVLGEAGRLDRIELKRLARSAIQPGIAALLETSLAHIDDSLIQEIEFLANGNPRNVGLLIECGRIEGFVYREGEGWTTDLPERERYVEGLLPREIELEFITSLRKLPPTHRQVSQALSLSPVPVPRAVLETVCRLNRTQSSMVFKDLVRDRIAVSRQRGGESCLALISLKVRTRLEGDVPLDDRAGIVDRIATEMEGVFGGEVSCVSVMAEIFGQTSRTEKTLAYRLAAGQQAFDDRRYGRAVQHLEEAQRCFHELSPRRQKKALTRRGFCPEVLERPVSPHYLFLLLAESLRTVGFFKRSAAAYAEGIERVKRKSADSALLHRGLGLARLQLHDYDGASQSFQEGQVEGVDNDPEVLGHQAHINLRKDRYQKALDALKEAGAALKKGADPSVRALLHHTVAEAYYLMGHWKESGRALDREKAVLEGESMNFFRPRHRVLQARLLLRRGKLLDAQDAIERVLAPAEGSENDPSHAQVHEMVGWIYLLQGEPGRGIDYFERALEKSTSDRFQTARAEEGLASAYLLSRDFEEAASHCGRGQELFDRVDCRRGRAATLHLRGRIATAAEDHEEAEFYFGYALKEYEELGVAWRLAALHVSQYELALARGQGARARKHLEVAIARARKQDDRPTLSRIFRLQGERLLAAGEGVKAERCFRNALVALR